MSASDVRPGGHESREMDGNPIPEDPWLSIAPSCLRGMIHSPLLIRVGLGSCFNRLAVRLLDSLVVVTAGGSGRQLV